MYKLILPLFVVLAGLAAIGSQGGEEQGPPPAPPALGGKVIVDFGVFERAPIDVCIDHTPGMTALDALQQVAEVELTAADPTHPQAIQSVDGIATDFENSRFWMLDVNGVHAQKMPQDIALLPGFEVVYRYLTPPVTLTLDYGPANRRSETVLVPFTKGMSAFDVLVEGADVDVTSADPTHPLAVDAINGVRTDLRASRFWMLDVNGKHAMDAAQNIEVGAGFDVTWRFMVPPVTVNLAYGPVKRPGESIQVPFRPGMTVLDALEAAADVELTGDDPLHPQAVASINGVDTDVERGFFWLYDVNGQHPTVMAHEYELGAGFEIDWTFSAPADRPADTPAQAEEPAQQIEEPAQQIEEPAQARGMLDRIGKQ